jgi:glycosyltransferase involved in cell wall biosynthesis
MTQPAVSVIIPAYQCAAVLEDAVASVRRQTWQDFEVIVVDDGSADDTWEAILRMAQAWPRLIPIRAAHAGLAAARNRGVREAKGQWIALLDADDVWLPTKLQRCMEFLAAHPDLSIVYTPMTPMAPDMTPLEGHNKPCHAGWLTEKLFYSIFVHDPAVVFHRRVLETCGGFDESLPVCVGHEFWLRVSTRFEFGLIDEPLARRRVSGQSTTKSNRARGVQIKAGMLEKFFLERGGKEVLKGRRPRLRLAKVHYNAGRVLYREGRYKEAAGYFAKAARYQGSFLRAHVMSVLSRLKGRREAG